MRTELSSKLYYIINKPRLTITMDLYEAERYESAVIVQSLIGNLVYYSNFGRYEPRLAKSWKRLKANLWEFELYPDLFCENGESINSQSFKKSLERTIKYLSKHDSTPILSKLVGYKKFIENKTDELEGIKIDNNKIFFEFVEPVRDGMLQILSFAPFGYISNENLNEDGSWKNKEKFISSGPYILSKIEIGKRYNLIRNPRWKLFFNKNAPKEIEFTTEIDKELNDGKPRIIDSIVSTLELPNEFQKYQLVPEYINPVLLGNLENGYFSNLNTRKLFKQMLSEERFKLEKHWDAHTRSQFFYPSQSVEVKKELNENEILVLPKYEKELIIEGELPKEKTPRAYAWKVLESVLEKANLKYRFANNEVNRKNISDRKFDIRLRGSSIGGGAEAWGLDILFCSDLGIRFPDPSGRICKLITDFNLDKITEKEFSNQFSTVVEEDSAVVPISHFGIQLYLSYPRL